MRAYKHFNKKNNNLQITEKVSEEIFSLPMYPELSIEKINKVINTINRETLLISFNERKKTKEETITHRSPLVSTVIYLSSTLFTCKYHLRAPQ